MALYWPLTNSASKENHFQNHGLDLQVFFTDSRRLPVIFIRQERWAIRPAVSQNSYFLFCNPEKYFSLKGCYSKEKYV